MCVNALGKQQLGSCEISESFSLEGHPFFSANGKQARRGNFVAANLLDPAWAFLAPPAYSCISLSIEKQAK